jgi:hypothetical protein
MPRDGVEPPTPAFSGQNDAFPFFFLNPSDVSGELYSQQVSMSQSTVAYRSKHLGSGSVCMEKWQKSAKIISAGAGTPHGESEFRRPDDFLIRAIGQELWSFILNNGTRFLR